MASDLKIRTDRNNPGARVMLLDLLDRVGYRTDLVRLAIGVLLLIALMVIARYAEANSGGS